MLTERQDVRNGKRPPQPILRNPIGFLLLPQFALMALSSAIEPLRIANRYLGRNYDWRLLSLDGRPVPDGSGLAIAADHGIDSCETLGTVFVCSALGPQRFYDVTTRDWLRGLDRKGVTLGGLDTGCFLLAWAGLLQGRRATLHWEVVDAFQEQFPGIPLRPTLFEIDNDRLSCAGGTAVLDMMLNAIALDHGAAVANRIAEHCLHDQIRNGTDWQRMALPMRSGAHHPTLVKALRLLDARRDSPPTMVELAHDLGVSSRHLLRLFRTHLGESPRHYDLRQRLEQARSMLLHTNLKVTQVACACGFQSPAHFTRAFRGQFGDSPSTARQALGMNVVAATGRG